MNALRITRAARADIDAMWAYVALQCPKRADRLLTAIMKSFELLAEFPRAGRQRFGREVPFRFFTTRDGVTVVYQHQGAKR